MKNFFLSVCVFFSVISFGQSPCKPTDIPVTIYPPNSITTSTTNTLEYLCGSNTIVYDTGTVSNMPCHWVYVNTGSTLTLKTICGMFQLIYIKNNCTLNILPGSSAGIFVTAEPGAVINDPTFKASVTTCSEIIYPVVDCGITSLQNYGERNKFVRVWPNPASTEINIQSLNSNNDVNSLTISNMLGAVVHAYVLDGDMPQQLDIKDLACGQYFFRIEYKTGYSQLKKFSVMR